MRRKSMKKRKKKVWKIIVPIVIVLVIAVVAVGMVSGSNAGAAVYTATVISGDIRSELSTK